MEEIENDEVFQEYFDEDSELDEEETKKKKKKKKRSTEMFVTMSLNEVFTTMTTERKILFRDFAKWLFDQRKILMYFHDMTNPSDPLQNMDNVHIEWRPEVGKEKGVLHLHAIVSIEHHGFYSF